MTAKQDSLRRYGLISICLLLAALILATFWEVQNYGFVFDDGTYVTNNNHVKAGFTKKSMLWALTATAGGNWHPVTWFSLFLDHELYGRNAGGYHWTNLLFHSANSLLLFLLLNRVTGALYRSAFVAALFALHPLHVESVAWVSERKDVLSTFFWLLTMWLYADYAKKPVVWRYGLVTGAFMLGLMSKPMLVTLPCVLLLFDFWPLQRASLSSPKKTLAALVLEKAPLLALSIVICLITIYSQRKVGAVMAFEAIPLDLRVQNAIVAYAEYIRKMLWPQGLAVFYPYFRTLPLVKLLLSAVFLAVISFFVVREGKKHAYLKVGWLWYVGTLFPVIGVIQVGRQALADRYTYIPLIGLFVMIAWGMAELLKQWRYKKIFFAGGAAAIIIILMVLSRTQAKVWENSVTLFTQAANVTAKNYLAHGNLGVALAERRDYEGAISHYREALRIKPDYAVAHTNLGDALVRCGKPDEAIEHFRTSLKLDPNYGRTRRHLADELVKKGRYEQAVSLYRQALQTEPDDAELYNNLGVALAQQNRREQAAQSFAAALRISPDYTEARNNLRIMRRLIGGPP